MEEHTGELAVMHKKKYSNHKNGILKLESYANYRRKADNLNQEKCKNPYIRNSVHRKLQVEEIQNIIVKLHFATEAVEMVIVEEVEFLEICAENAAKLYCINMCKTKQLDKVNTQAKEYSDEEIFTLTGKESVNIPLETEVNILIDSGSSRNVIYKKKTTFEVSSRFCIS